MSRRKWSQKWTPSKNWVFHGVSCKFSRHPTLGFKPSKQPIVQDTEGLAPKAGVLGQAATSVWRSCEDDNGQFSSHLLKMSNKFNNKLDDTMMTYDLRIFVRSLSPSPSQRVQ